MEWSVQQALECDDFVLQKCMRWFSMQDRVENGVHCGPVRYQNIFTLYTAKGLKESFNSNILLQTVISSIYCDLCLVSVYLLLWRRFSVLLGLICVRTFANPWYLLHDSSCQIKTNQ